MKLLPKEEKELNDYYKGSNQPIGEWFLRYKNLLFLQTCKVGLHRVNDMSNEAISQVFEELMTYPPPERVSRFPVYQREGALKAILCTRVLKKSINIARIEMPKHKKYDFNLKDNEAILGYLEDKNQNEEEYLEFLNRIKSILLETIYHKTFKHDYIIFKLSFLKHYTMAAVAEELDITENEVRVAIRRIRRNLRRKLKF